MSRRTRPIPKLRITIDLDGEDRERWKVYALRLGVSLEHMIASSVEAAIARGSTRSNGRRSRRA
jgi:hypothetical protein